MSSSNRDKEPSNEYEQKNHNGTMEPIRRSLEDESMNSSVIHQGNSDHEAEHSHEAEHDQAHEAENDHEYNYKYTNFEQPTHMKAVPYPGSDKKGFWKYMVSVMIVLFVFCSIVLLTVFIYMIITKDFRIFRFEYEVAFFGFIAGGLSLFSLFGYALVQVFEKEEEVELVPGKKTKILRGKFQKKWVVKQCGILLEDLKTELKTEFLDLKTELLERIEDLKTELLERIEDLKN